MTPAEYRALRESVGTQSAVAERLGVHPQTVSDRERGKIRVTQEAALALRALAAASLDDAP